jgi:hypothetical protein
LYGGAGNPDMSGLVDKSDRTFEGTRKGVGELAYSPRPARKRCGRGVVERQKELLLAVGDVVLAAVSKS